MKPTRLVSRWILDAKSVHRRTHHGSHSLDRTPFGWSLRCCPNELQSAFQRQADVGQPELELVGLWGGSGDGSRTSRRRGGGIQRRAQQGKLKWGRESEKSGKNKPKSCVFTTWLELGLKSHTSVLNSMSENTPHIASNSYYNFSTIYIK